MMPLYFSLHANSIYWQGEIADEDRDETNFASHYRLFRFTRMSFSLNNTLRTFQLTMDIILSTGKRLFVFVYIYDIIILSKSCDGRTDNVRRVLSLLKDNGVTIKLNKCRCSKFA